MPDQLDRAKKLEMGHRQASLENTLQQAQEPPQEILDGVVVCIDCGINIPLDRLAAKPDAARCINCQSRKESVHGR